MRLSTSSRRLSSGSIRASVMPDFIESVLSERHLKAIGLLFLRISMIESIIIDLLVLCMKTDTIRILAAFSHHQFASKIDTLKAIAQFTVPSHKIDGFFDLLSKARAIGEKRNMIAHAYWTFDEDGTTLAVRFTSREGRFERKRTRMPAETIEQWAEEAKQITVSLHHFRLALRAYLASAPSPSPDKSHPPASQDGTQ
jgi:hypothetical protein